MPPIAVDGEEVQVTVVDVPYKHVVGVSFTKARRVEDFNIRDAVGSEPAENRICIVRALKLHKFFRGDPFSSNRPHHSVPPAIKAW
jgi:hypothetical protein